MTSVVKTRVPLYAVTKSSLGFTYKQLCGNNTGLYASPIPVRSRGGAPAVHYDEREMAQHRLTSQTADPQASRGRIKFRTRVSQTTLPFIYTFPGGKQPTCVPVPDLRPPTVCSPTRRSSIHVLPPLTRDAWITPNVCLSSTCQIHWGETQRQRGFHNGVRGGRWQRC